MKNSDNTHVENCCNEIFALTKLLKESPRDIETLLSLGKSYLSIDELDEALFCYLKAVQINPFDDFAWYSLGDFYRKVFMYHAAIICYEKAIELAEEMSSLISISACYLQLKNYENAIIYVEKVLTQSPRDERAVRLKNNIEEAIQLDQEAISSVKSHKSSESKDSEKNPTFIEGISLYKQENYLEAKDFFTKCYNEHKDKESLIYLGYCEMNLHNNSEALSIFSKVEGEFNAAVEALYNQTAIFLDRNEYEQALCKIKQAILITPKDSNVWFYYGRYLQKKNMFKTASKAYKISLQIDKTQIETLYHLGLCYYKLEEYSKAYNCFDAILAVEDDQGSRTMRGMSSIALKEYEKAIGDLVSYDVNVSSNVENRLDIAHCYYQLKDFEKAQEWLGKVQELEEDNQIALNMLNLMRKKNR